MIELDSKQLEWLHTGQRANMRRPAENCLLTVDSSSGDAEGVFRMLADCWSSPERVYVLDVGMNYGLANQIRNCKAHYIGDGFSLTSEDFFANSGIRALFAKP